MADLDDELNTPAQPAKRRRHGPSTYKPLSNQDIGMVEVSSNESDTEDNSSDENEVKLEDKNITQ